jgi:hypothetical protein
MPELTAAQIEAGRRVKRALERAEEAHPNSLALHRLHGRLAQLVASFEGQLPAGDFEAFGGGTPKTPDDDE